MPVSKELVSVGFAPSAQLWLFQVTPIAAALVGFVSRWLADVR